MRDELSMKEKDEFDISSSSSHNLPSQKEQLYGLMVFINGER